jgi:hypothetical protein
MTNYHDLKFEYEKLIKQVQDNLTNDTLFNQSNLLNACKAHLLKFIQEQEQELPLKTRADSKNVVKKDAKPKVKKSTIKAFVEISNNKSEWELEINNLLKENFFVFANKKEAILNNAKNKLALLIIELFKKNIIDEKQNHNDHKIFEVTNIKLSQIKHIIVDNKEHELASILKTKDKA